MDVTIVFALGVLLVRFGLLVAGVLFCWFGYRLFALTKTHGNADLSVKNIFKLNLQHVGPGVFFSLFGTTILLLSIYRPPTLDARAAGWSGRGDVKQAPAAATSVTIAGARSQAPLLDNRARLNEMREQIGFLNRLREGAKVMPEDQADLPRLAREIKLSLMRANWLDAWGDQAVFESWARDPSSGSPDPEARRIFEQR